MTLDALKMWRKVVPFGVFSASLLPGTYVALDNLNDTLSLNQLLAPALALVPAFLYVALDVRGPLWRKENDTHVGQQIRAAVIQMIPSDLQVSEVEKKRLESEAILKDLTGVFWEAVGRDRDLSSHKQHFYSNGIVYTTAFDVFLICGFMAICYLAMFAFLRDAGWLVAGAGLLIVAIISRVSVVSQVRKHHLSLSAEQLDMLRRHQREFVSTRLREIIAEWRQSSARAQIVEEGRAHEG